MTVLKIHYVITRQWLKLHLPNFHTFYTNSLPSRLSPLYKDLTDKFPAILDSFLLGVDCIRQVPIWVGGGGGQDDGFKFMERKV